MDRDNRIIYINDNAIDLSPKLFTLLCYLVFNRDRVVSNKEIITVLWPEHEQPRFMTGSDVKQQIFLLRKRIEVDYRRPQLIKNIRGFGYKFDFDELE